MKQNLAVAIGATIVTVFLVEVLLRAVGIPDKLSGWGWEDYPGRRLSQYDDLTTNQFGYRGQPIRYGRDDYVVVLVGDSQVEAYASPPEQMPEQFLQKSLASLLNRPVGVFSLAASGWGQDQQYLALQEYFRAYRADLVLLWATPGNDFWENAFPDRSVTRRAGHLKPTFRLVDQELHGPYFESGSYLHHSAIAQLVESAIAKLNRETLQRRILRDWLEDLPAPHEQAHEFLCEQLTVIEQAEFYRTVFELDPNIGYTVSTREDFIDSRSHFSPYLSDPSTRDGYLIGITASLLRRIAEEVESNNAKFAIFYPVREDLDRRAAQMAKCVSDSEGNLLRVSLDHKSLLQSVSPPESLVTIDLAGGNEIVTSPDDRHLNSFGNEQAMQKLALSLIERAIFSE